MGPGIKSLALSCALSLSMLSQARAEPPKAATVQAAESAAATGVVVDLNSATAAELEQLPGIGPSRAVAIIAFREKHGGFTQLSQLMRIKGIGRAMLRKLRPHLTLLKPAQAAAGPRAPDPLP